MKGKKTSSVLLLAASLLLSACATDHVDNDVSSSSPSSTSDSSPSSVVKAKYSLSITNDDPLISISDMDGNPLLNEYEEDTVVSFKVVGPDNYTIRVYLNDFQLKSSDGTYSFLMARNSNIVIEGVIATYHVSFTGISMISLSYCDSEGNVLAETPESFVKGEDVYFSLSANESVDKRHTYFHSHCFVAKIKDTVLTPNDKGVYKIEGIKKNTAVDVIAYDHEFQDGECVHCHKSEETLAIHQTNETADVTYNETAKGWKISAVAGKKVSEVAIRKAYLLSLFEKHGDTLELSFGNGYSFGYDQANGNPMRTTMSMETRNETGRVKWYTNAYFAPDSLGDDGSDDYRSYIKIERSDIEDEACDGNIYLYFNYESNSTFVTEGKDTTEVYSAFITIDKAVTHAPADPRPATVLIGDSDSFITNVSYQKDLGYVLTPKTAGASCIRMTLSASALSFYREQGRSKVTIEISEPFDGSTSNIADTLFSFAPWTSTGFNALVENGVVGSYEQGSFTNGDKTITTYKASFDLASKFGANWDSVGTYYIWFGIHFTHLQQFRDSAAYIHSITFTE